MNNHDSSLQSPQDANTGKHINFSEKEEAGTTTSQSSDEDEQSPAKQQWKEMREERMNDSEDLSLQSPQEANTQKHIDFIEIEEAGVTATQSSGEDEQSPAKQQWKEMREERKDKN